MPFIWKMSFTMHHYTLKMFSYGVPPILPSLALILSSIGHPLLQNSLAKMNFRIECSVVNSFRINIILLNHLGTICLFRFLVCSWTWELTLLEAFTYRGFQDSGSFRWSFRSFNAFLLHYVFITNMFVRKIFFWAYVVIFMLGIIGGLFLLLGSHWSKCSFIFFIILSSWEQCQTSSSSAPKWVIAHSNSVGLLHQW